MTPCDEHVARDFHVEVFDIIGLVTTVTTVTAYFFKLRKEKIDRTERDRAVTADWNVRSGEGEISVTDRHSRHSRMFSEIGVTHGPSSRRHRRPNGRQLRLALYSPSTRGRWTALDLPNAQSISGRSPVLSTA